VSNRELGLPSTAPPAPLPPEVYSSLAGDLLADAVNELEPGQSLTVEVQVQHDRGRSLKVGVEVRDDRGAKFYEIVVTLGP
jgi:hypothetical protein